MTALCVFLCYEGSNSGGPDPYEVYAYTNANFGGNILVGLNASDGALLDPSIYINAPQGLSVISASGVNYPSFNSPTIASTPEPSTLALFGTGILLMGGLALRKKGLLGKA